MRLRVSYERLKSILRASKKQRCKIDSHMEGGKSVPIRTYRLLAKLWCPKSSLLHWFYSVFELSRKASWSMWTLSFTRVGPIWGRFWASWAPSWIPETAPNRRNIYPSPLLASKMASGPDIEKHYRTAVKDYFWRTMSVEASNQSDCDTLFGASLNRCKIAAKSLRSESVKNRSLEPRGGDHPNVVYRFSFGAPEPVSVYIEWQI